MSERRCPLDLVVVVTYVAVPFCVRGANDGRGASPHMAGLYVERESELLDGTHPATSFL